MTADLGFVANAAQGHADESAAEGARDRPAERRLADARRPDETEDRAVQATDQPEDGDVIEDAVLDLLEAVVVLVQHAPRVLDVQDVVRALGPGDAEHPVEVVAPDRRFG